MFLNHYLPIVLFAFSASITPGPNNIMIMTSSLNFGLKKSMGHFAGICLGVPVMFAGIGLGLGSIFEQFPVFHQVIKVTGGLYLLYLAARIALTDTRKSGNKKSVSTPLSVYQAVLFQWVNPKAWIMGISAMAAFTAPGEDIFTGVIIVSLVFFIVLVPSVSAWMFFGASLQKFLNKPEFRRIFNIVMAALLAGSVIAIFIKDIQSITGLGNPVS